MKKTPLPPVKIVIEYLLLGVPNQLPSLLPLWTPFQLHPDLSLLKSLEGVHLLLLLVLD